MKYIKTFEGHGRIKFSEDGKQVICGPVSLPQSWDCDKEQSIGFNPNDLIMSEDGCYNYIWDENDHVDQKDIDKMIYPHVKKSNNFGFDPSL